MKLNEVQNGIVQELFSAKRFNTDKLKYNLLPFRAWGKIRHENTATICDAERFIIMFYNGDDYCLANALSEVNSLMLKNDLTPYDEVTRVMMFGSVKYDPVLPNKHHVSNWWGGMPWSYCIQSALRHLECYKRGETHDAESGLSHLAHLMCNLLFIAEYFYIYPQGDDRPHWKQNKLRVGLDLDGVVADFFTAYKERFEFEGEVKTYNIEPDFIGNMNRLAQDNEAGMFYMNLGVLDKPSDFVPSCYITARDHFVSPQATHNWMERHNEVLPYAPVYQVGNTRDKIQLIVEQDLCDIYVDDSPTAFIEFRKAGIACYLYDAPYNQHVQAGSYRIKNLAELKTKVNI